MAKGVFRKPLCYIVARRASVDGSIKRARGVVSGEEGNDGLYDGRPAGRPAGAGRRGLRGKARWRACKSALASQSHSRPRTQAVVVVVVLSQPPDGGEVLKTLSPISATASLSSSSSVLVVGVAQVAAAASAAAFSANASPTFAFTR